MKLQTWVCVVVLSLAACSAPEFASAQEMTVYTTVSDVGNGDAPRTIGSSLTLFHAGKVYDYMEDAGELVVLEPNVHRLTLLNSNYTATRVEFSELLQFLKVAETESAEYILELSQQTDPGSGRVRSLLQFQLTPQFQEDSATKNRLVLRGGVMNYDVRTADSPDPQQVKQYLMYADWAARLNFVLHPGSSYPAPRLILNDALRRKGALPVAVELSTMSENPVRLAARHTYQWELQATDRSHIHKWTQLLESEKVRWVSFHEYQARLLADIERHTR